MSAIPKLENPYLDKFRAIGGDSYERNNAISTYAKRDEMVQRYAWAVPNTEAIETLVDYSPLIEIAAGSGYWASLIEQMGGDIDAYDKAPWEDTFTDVIEGTEAVADAYPERTLFLCWPPYGDSMAAEALKSYDGLNVAYVGEGRSGCTADDEFHSLLEANWNREETIHIPQWWGMHDILEVYQRR